MRGQRRCLLCAELKLELVTGFEATAPCLGINNGITRS